MIRIVFNIYLWLIVAIIVGETEFQFKGLALNEYGHSSDGHSTNGYNINPYPVNSETNVSGTSPNDNTSEKVTKYAMKFSSSTVSVNSSTTLKSKSTSNIKPISTKKASKSKVVPKKKPVLNWPMANKHKVTRAMRIIKTTTKKPYTKIEQEKMPELFIILLILESIIIVSITLFWIITAYNEKGDIHEHFEKVPTESVSNGSAPHPLVKVDPTPDQNNTEQNKQIALHNSTDNKRQTTDSGIQTKQLNGKVTTKDGQLNEVSESSSADSSEVRPLPSDRSISSDVITPGEKN